MSRRIAFVFTAVLVAGLTPVAPARALSADLVISQVYGGGGNAGATYTHDFVELFNRGSTTASLAGMSVQYTSSTGTGNFGTSGLLTQLSGSLSPGQHYLVQLAQGAGGTTPLPTPDATGVIAMGASNGKVALVNSTTGLGCNGGSTPCSPAQLALIKDLVGYGDANFYEGAGAVPALSSTTAALRLNGGCTETDNNISDFATGAPTPRNTAAPLSPCTGPDTAPSVTSTVPVNGAMDFPTTANLTVTFSEPVTVVASWFTLTCSTSGSVAATVSGGPTTFTLDPVPVLVMGESCTLTVLASQVTDQDADDPPDTMATDHVVGFSPLDMCLADTTSIPAIQGNGPVAAVTGPVLTKGVVVGDFEGSAGPGGFYLQDAAGDGNPSTSDGIFVYTGSADLVTPGQVVVVKGYARERYGQTTLNGSAADSAAVPAGSVWVCGSDVSVAATDVALPFVDVVAPERYEGMLVRFPQDLVISEYFNYDRYGEIVLALPLPGEARPFTGTQLDEPGAAANARTLANTLRRITLDDGANTQNPIVLRHPNGTPFSLTNRFRGGDMVTNTVGILGYDYSLYRVYPTGPATYTAANSRPAAQQSVGGTLRAASLSTMNYFLTGDDSANGCGPAKDMQCRGWDADQSAEFTRQRDKLLAALSGLDADIIGLTEFENTTGVEPLADLVSGLTGYAYVDTGTIGTDAIRVGLIYRTAKVAPVGAFQVLDSSDDPRFLDTRNRPSLAQTFQDKATGERFTVVVNHFKSKGSACSGDPDTGDGQGECNLTRSDAAKALVDWLATDPTGSGDLDFLVLGDLNAYAQEDPIDALKAGPDDSTGTADDYTDLIATYQGPFAYSYTFDGQAGDLDHALASGSLASRVTGATQWHINSDEPDVLDYDTSFKPPAQDLLYEANAYRSSDHDAVLVGLDSTVAPGAPTGLAGTPGDGQIELSWSAPDFTGGAAISGYRIETKTGNGPWAVTTANTGSTATSATVTGLINGTEYRFRVAAINAAGTGPASTATDPLIPRTMPPPVKQTQVGPKPPKRIKQRGVTVLTKKNARTNAGLRVVTKVTGKGKGKAFTVIKARLGKVSVRTFGKKHWKLTLVQSAPSTDAYNAYLLRTVYVNGKRR